ncbi:MAG TPA: damage-control phosphatase ARMT1 family protein [Kineosporiaceae bacterium]|nr:damage-control phosphatase ARMT1 family protein [Kineosporiaceae bacterium]
MTVSGIAEPIRSDRPGSFPWTVLHDRHPALLQQVRGAYPYPPEQRRALDRLEREIAGVIEPLAPGLAWAGWEQEYLGLTWYEVPFLWAENYFYRKLLAAVGYLTPGPWQGIDPFAPLKAAELAGPAVDAELAALEGLSDLTPGERIDALLLAALWGNRADLGFLIQAESRPERVDHLVVDDRDLLRRLLPTGASGASGASGGVAPGRIVLVADNAGGELLPDLVLIDQLLETGLATEVLLHIKPYPYFVSDATTADVLAAVARLVAGPATASLIGHRLRTAIETGRLTIRAHPFSVAPLGYQDLPDDLRAELATASLTIMKGDLNYRRLVGDRHWPATSDFTKLTGYFPSPVVALRTLKSDVIVGLDPAAITELDGTGTAWRTSGSHGLIQARA